VCGSELLFDNAGAAGAALPGWRRDGPFDVSEDYSDVRGSRWEHRLVFESGQWDSARSFLLENASTAWQNACEAQALTLENLIRLRLASTNAIRMAADVVDIAYNLCGSHAIFADHAIQRRFQDVHTITQQIQGRLAHYERAGQFFLDLEPEGW
jgi:alkylation response protein AidB-like acyl-CoA dehydrogenase